MKIYAAKFAHSLKVGESELTFLTSEKYDIELNGHTISITDRGTKASVKTTLYNCIWFDDTKPKAGKGNTIRDS